MKRISFLLAPALALGLAPCVSASTTELADWCFNINGNILSACNGAGSQFFPGSTFDTTLEPGSNNLGTATFAVGVGQYANAYMDYDLDFSTYGSFQDYGTINGTAPAGVSWELSDPNISTIFSDFAANSLTDVNSVATAGGPPNVCCDVSWALGVENPFSKPAFITFTVSTTPPNGFYLQQTNFDVGDNIYLSENVTPVPEGSTGNMLVIPLAGMALAELLRERARKRRAARI